MKQSNELTEFLESFRREVLPTFEASGFSISIYDGRFNAEFALELGAAILLDKPLILVVLHGVNIPPKLQAVADSIVAGDPNSDPAVAEMLQREITRVVQKLKR